MGTDNFSSTLDSLKGFQVNLYVGEEIIKGKLMGVETDHIVIEDENKYIYYYNIDKIQAITKNTKQFKSAEITDYMKTQSLKDLLLSLKNSWVTILCVNTQTFSGVLSIVDSDFVTLISGEERILVKISHISNILKGYKKQEKSNSAQGSDNSNTAQSSENSNVVTANANSEDKKANHEEKETAKVVINETKKEKKVWSEPIKNATEKTVIVASAKSNKEIKKSKSEMKQSEKKQQKTEVKQNHANEPKIQKNEVIHQVNNRENELVQPLLMNGSKEKKVPVKNSSLEVPPMRMDNPTPKVEQPKKTVKNVQKELETPPFMKMDGSKKNVTENRRLEEKPKAQEVGASRFAGEPVSRDFDRRSIFSGWPNRKPSPRRF